MKYVSCRRDFDNVDGDPVANVAWFGKPAPEGQELVMVHGYNCLGESTRDVFRANAEMAREMGIKIPVVGYQWPGLGGNIFETVSFHRAQAQADASAVRLAEYLNAGSPHAVLAHSLGSKVVLEAIAKHKAQLKLLFLIGPAVDDDSLSGAYKTVGQSVGEVHVFWSSRDEVLGNAYALDQQHAALGHSGPAPGAPANVFAHDVTNVVGSHGSYRFDRAIWQLIGHKL